MHTFYFHKTFRRSQQYKSSSRYRLVQLENDEYVVQNKSAKTL